MIKVIAFDFAGVQYRIHNKDFIDKLQKYSDLDYYKLYKKVLNSDDYDLFETGKISVREYLKRTKSRIKLTISLNKFISLFNDRFREILSTTNLIKNLSKKYKLFLISNTNKVNYERVIEKSRGFRYFENIITSFQFGYMKPKIAIYLELIRVTNCEPSEILFIDDKKINVLGAKKLGIIAIQYTSYRNLIYSLKKYKVKI
ncbi:MAG TPA: HAD-IA family hydrolase [Candidatus Nanoarchaeia archaeon]|nr:HAD-IA family hydrolase [Candidatus Nanoarchaeia archaeon]